MTGIEQIAKERQEQVDKHRYTPLSDQSYTQGELLKASASIILEDSEMFPFSPEYFLHLMEKPRDEQLAIAGAFVAAELDRVEFKINQDIENCNPF